MHNASDKALPLAVHDVILQSPFQRTKLFRNFWVHIISSFGKVYLNETSLFNFLPVSHYYVVNPHNI